MSNANEINFIPVEDIRGDGGFICRGDGEHFLDRIGTYRRLEAVDGSSYYRARLWEGHIPRIHINPPSATNWGGHLQLDCDTFEELVASVNRYAN